MSVNHTSSNSDTTDTTEKSRIGWKKKALICAIILLLGAGATGYIFTTEPTATRTGATRESAMLVDVTGVEAGSFHPTIVAMGTVRPARDIILRPRVSGEIMERSDAFTPGGFVEKGDVLLRIDPADYRNSLQQRKSELQQADADLKIEMGRQQIAEKEYRLHNKSLSAENKALVLRQPQLDAAKARVESARAAVEQARLELDRTTVVAPFDAHILSRNVNVGSQVSSGDELGRLVGLNTYWVEATVPLSKLHRLSFPDAETPTGAEVEIRNRTSWPDGATRTGHLYKMIGELEGQTRMARVLVSVDDPLAYRTGSSDMPALMIGSFVETRMKAREIPDIVRLPRDYVHDNDTVWVMEDGKLAIREVAIDFRDAEHAYISSGLAGDERVVTTNLATVVEGASLRVQGEDSQSNQNIAGSENPEDRPDAGEAGS